MHKTQVNKVVGWLRDDHVDPDGRPHRMTFGSGGVDDRWGAALPSGWVRLYSWETVHDSLSLVSRRVKCRSYRRAVRLLRQHLKGYNV